MSPEPISPAVTFFTSLGAGVAGAAALMRPGEVKPGVWRLQAIVATACLGLGLLLGVSWLAGFGTDAIVACSIAIAAAGLGGILGGRAARACMTVALVAGCTALLCSVGPGSGGVGAGPAWLTVCATLTAVAVLGTATASMLLGHWYLVDHGMLLAPLRRLTLAYGVAVVARLVTLGIGLAFLPDLSARFSDAASFLRGDGALLLLVATFGMLMPPILAALAWGTLRVPNTRSTTGILYVAVIAAIVGDLAARGAAL